MLNEFPNIYIIDDFADFIDYILVTNNDLLANKHSFCDLLYKWELTTNYNN